MSYREINFDGLVGPTHNYAGLAFGNLASSRNRTTESNPRAAALEGLDKMQLLIDLGVPQAVLPPLPRPDIARLRQLGFGGTPQQVLQLAWQQAPDLFAACCSASSMWTANAATVAPSCDTASGKLLLTPANLVTNFHRSIEAEQTTQLLRAMFADSNKFQVNDPLPGFAGLADEGAANHMRLGGFDQPGVHLFVYGTADHLHAPTRRYPARQTLAACQAVARLNQLDAQRVFYIQQNPAAIDAGAFHNDVVAVSHQQHLFCHERAFVDQPQVLDRIRQQLDRQPLQILEVKSTDIPLDLAISTYLFNSQIVTTGAGQTCMIFPAECADNGLVRDFISERIVGSGFAERAVFANVRQSMRNGGGPACLRLRVVMAEAEVQSLCNNLLLDADRIAGLRNIILSDYPEQLALDQLQSLPLVEQLENARRKIYHYLGLSPGAVT